MPGTGKVGLEEQGVAPVPNPGWTISHPCDVMLRFFAGAVWGSCSDVLPTLSTKAIFV